MDLKCCLPGTRACGPARSGYQRESRRGWTGVGDAADERRVFLHALGKDGWQLGVIQGVSRDPEEPRPYTVNFLDLDARYNVALQPEKYSVDVHAPPYSCFVMNVKSRSVKRHGF